MLDQDAMVPAKYLREANERIGELEEELARLKGDGSEDAELVARCRKVFGISPTTSLMLLLLLRRELCSLSALRDSYTENTNLSLPWVHDEIVDLKTVDVHIWRLRKKLAPFGIVIETVFGQGKMLPPASKAIVRRMLNLETAKAA